MGNISIQNFIKKISKYGSVSVITMLLDFFLLYLIDYMPSLPRAGISIFTYLLGSTLGYFLNKKYVFSPGWLKNRRNFELMLYIATGILGSLVTGMLFYFTATLGITNIVFQKMISAPISFIVVFLFRNYIIFKI